MEYKVSRYGEGNDLVIMMREEDPAGILGDLQGIRVINIYGYDWNMYMSPWPAQKIFRQGEDFGGQADEMVQAVASVLAKETYDHAYLMGYSLAGLFSLYAATKIRGFTGIASVSGSLWFPDFAEYIQTHPVLCERVYLSLGDKEKKTKNPVMSTVEEKTEQVRDLLEQYCTVTYELNPGGHFQDPDMRMHKALQTLVL